MGEIFFYWLTKGQRPRSLALHMLLRQKVAQQHGITMSLAMLLTSCRICATKDT